LECDGREKSRKAEGALQSGAVRKGTDQTTRQGEKEMAALIHFYGSRERRHRGR
jgi:hypothetical protein